VSPRFSVVVTTFDRPGLLAGCLESVATQTVGDLECIVVDDGSATAREVLPDDRRFRVLDLPTNGGETRARQAGVAAATGEVVCFLDDDDRWTPDRLALAAEGLRRAPVALCWSRWADEPGRGGGRVLDGWVGDVIVDAIAPSLGATAVRRDVLVPFDEGFRANGDTEWWIRQAAAAPVSTVPRLGQLVGRHPGARHGNDDDARLAASHQLLAVHRDYYRAHRRARAFRWYRIAVLEAQRGRRGLAATALARSLAARPSARALAQLGRLGPRPDRSRPRRVPAVDR